MEVGEAQRNLFLLPPALEYLCVLAQSSPKCDAHFTYGAGSKCIFPAIHHVLRGSRRGSSVHVFADLPAVMRVDDLRITRVWYPALFVDTIVSAADHKNEDEDY